MHILFIINILSIYQLHLDMNILFLKKYKYITKHLFIGSIGSIGYLNFLYFNNIDKKDRINLVFDLDETLINSKKSKIIQRYNMSGSQKHDHVCICVSENKEIDELTKETISTQHSYFVWKRPFVNPVFFILSKYNNLYLLTRGSNKYATNICDGIDISDYFIEKKFRDDINSYNEKNNSKGKSLAIFDNIDIDNSILIDDLNSNHVDNQRFIHITPYSFCKCFDFELVKLLFNVSFQNIKHIFK
jgi:TFIIF-interacting CTD phosphatase-like protein